MFVYRILLMRGLYIDAGCFIGFGSPGGAGRGNPEVPLLDYTHKMCSLGSSLKTEADISHNTKIKVYSNGSIHVTCCNKAIFHEKGYELFSYTESSSKPKVNYNTANASRSDSIKRARQSVFDIAQQNDFTYFVTLTLDSTKMDRYDSKIVRKKLQTWLHNMETRHSLTYLLLPEYHKDNAIHMHMLCSGNLSLTDSGKKDKSGRTIYNMNNWKYGFSTAIIMDGDKLHTAKYVTKYVTKDSQKIFGKFYYSGGKDLQREVPFFLADFDYTKFDALSEFKVPGCNIRFRYPNDEQLLIYGSSTDD